MCFKYSLLWIFLVAAISTSAMQSPTAIALLSKTLASIDNSQEKSSKISEATVDKSRKQTHDEEGVKSLHEQKDQDPFVNASPLSVAAVCSDGVLLISLHYGFDDDHHERNEDEGEKLKITSSSNITAPSITITHGTNENEVSNGLTSDKEGNTRSTKHPLSHAFCDLPISTRGPLRIEQVYNHASPTSQQTKKPLPPPMAILTAGWRTDGMTLASAARELISEERMLYCLPYLAMSDGGGVLGARDNHQTNLLTENSDGKEVAKKIITTQPYYGRRIAEGLSYYLAKCEFSESTRPLSTVGLLACGSNGGIDGEGSIFLIDATGSYRVRAHAIGAGASFINKKMGYINFWGMSCREGLEALLGIIAEKEEVTSPGIESPTSTESISESEPSASDKVAKPAFVTLAQNQNSKARPWNLPLKIELAIIQNGEGKMRRVQLATLNQQENK